MFYLLDFYSVLLLITFYILFSPHCLRRPVKAAIAAASEHLAGLLPHSLVYSHAHETAIEVCASFIMLLLSDTVCI